MLFHCIECEKNLDESNFYREVKTRCKDCLNKKFKCELCGKFLTEKWLTTHIDREHNHNESNFNVLEKTNIDNINNNNRTLLVGPSFSGETYLMLQILSRISDRDIYIITKSPPEQHTNSKIKLKKINDEIKPLNEYENGIIVFDDIVGSSNSRFIDQFFIRGRHNNLDIYYLSQSYFNLSKRTIRNKSNRIILFNKTLKDIEHIYRDVAGYDMTYDEFKELCRKSWDEDYNCLYIDRTKKEIKENIVFLMKAKKHIWKQHLRQNFFDYHTKLYSVFKSFKCYIQLKIEKI